MKWASAITEIRSLPEALDDLARSIRNDLPEDIDLAIVFVSPYYQNDFDALPSLLSDRLGCRVLVGCSAGGVIGGSREIERRPAISLLAGSLPGVTIRPFHLDQSGLPSLDDSPRKWQNCFSNAADATTLPDTKGHLGNGDFIILADPFTMDVEKVLSGLDYAYPAAVKIGGLASGAQSPGQNGLFINKIRYRSGMIGVALSGNISIDPLIAQGCRPIGRPFSMTQSEKNVLLEIEGRKPAEFLQDLYETLSEPDAELMQHSLFIGLAMTPFKETLSRGDFLIRNLIGIDSKNGAISVGALLQEGQSAQFHLRDKETSAEDLKWYLSQYQIEKPPKSARGALIFSCLGRGTHLYGEPDFDTRLFHAHMGFVPMSGFFCNGEIGPVGDTTFLHGYTSCIGIFREPSE
ncbi:MAG: FIST N-terminal domain-containing protein [Nitrospirota bacterium]